VKAGYIRVIITTNFDRLQESALVDVGIQPQVISTADAIKGAMPLSHAGCVVLKINGDYLDSRIKNTKAELSDYDSNLDSLLDRIFDEFGLIVCGWSGDWDIALRRAIERCPNRRFSMYWAARGEPNSTVQDLIRLRAGTVIPIESADAFFSMLREKVFALQQLGKDHPLSAKIAAIQTKRYIVKSEDRILLHDLAIKEAERAYAAMDPSVFHARHVGNVATEAANRFHLYENSTEVLLSIMITGCYWGQEEHTYLWQKVLKRLGDPPGSPDGLVAWVALRFYPATLLMYAGGIAAIAGRRFQNLACVLSVTFRTPYEDREEVAARRFSASQVLRDGLHKFVPGKENHRTPLSDHLFEVLREPFRETVPADDDYDEAFLMFEYLQGLLVWSSSPGRSLIGRAGWKKREMFTAQRRTAVTNSQIAEGAVALLPKGTDYEAVKAAYEQWVLNVTSEWY
jgi:hypothetical protein